MRDLGDLLSHVTRSDTLHPHRSQLLRQVDVVAQFLGVGATVIRHGLRPVPGDEQIALGALAVLMMGWLCVSLSCRYRWSLARTSFIESHRVIIGILAVWAVGVVSILLFGPLLPDWRGLTSTRTLAFIHWSEWGILIRGAAGIVRGTRRAAARGTNPAVVLVLSFVLLVAVGTALLMLPRARAHTPGDQIGGAPFLVSLFTATSASCVTGLAVESTGTYWTPFGQSIILGLFQIGGLGIMTWGALFALAAGGQMQFRESATMADMLESEGLGTVRQLLLAILAFTFSAELIGAVFLSTLWSDLPLWERCGYSVFHSVSAFCNAGFALQDDSFVQYRTTWQIWGVVSTLIILGGLGFGVMYNLALVMWTRFRTLEYRPMFRLPRHRVRLTLGSRLVLVTTASLLVFGAAGYHLLESTDPDREISSTQALCDAWFQSVTFRTAGFNTVEHGDMQPVTKLFAIPLMFIGASPGSTGGGVKTISFALVCLAVIAILRGRNHVEVFGRKVPPDLVNRALAINLLGVLVVMTVTMLLVLFERQPELLIDHLFEATSAFATVGVSTGITPTLSDESKIVITVAMFLGRVGPLTLLMALAGGENEGRYDYPIERVSLG